MAGASIGGLVSGLDTATIISQLMQLEARPQTMLKSRVSSAERAVTALQTFNSKLAGLVTKAAELANADTWAARTATSDNEGVTVTASGTSAPGSLTFAIEQVATPTKIDYGTVQLSDRVTDAVPPVVYLKLEGSTDPAVPLDTKDGTVKGLVDAINSSNKGITATAVRQELGGYRLSVTSTRVGTASGFTLTANEAGDVPLLIGSGTPTAGVGARIRVGSDQALTSATDTFTELMPGVSVTLKAGATGAATITVGRDTKSIVDKVKGLVDVVNTALAEIDSLTATGADPKARGLLSGDSTLRQVRSELLQAVTYGVGGASLASYGVSTDRTGKLVFDEAKLEAAYEADPAKTTAMFAAAEAPSTTNGLAATVEKIAKAYSNSTDGIVSQSIKSRQGAIKGMQDDIADWDVRLEVKRNALQRQYTALETALGKLQSQGNWLAGQLASLPQMNSGQ